MNSQGEYFNSGICRFKQTLTHSIVGALEDISDFIIMHFSIHTIRCHQVIATPISLETNWTGFERKKSDHRVGVVIDSVFSPVKHGIREPGQSGKFRSTCERNNNKCNSNTAIKLTLIPSSVIKTNGHLNLIDTVLNQRSITHKTAHLLD